MPVSRRAVLGSAALGFLTGAWNLRWATALDQIAQQGVPNQALPPAPERPGPQAPGESVSPCDPPELVPRIWNQSREPFTFRFGRRIGPVWSEPHTIAPGEFLALDDTVPNFEEIEHLHQIDGRAIIQYRDYCGLMTHYVNVAPANETIRSRYTRFFCGTLTPAERAQLAVRLPYVYVIRDPDGHVHLIYANAVEIGIYRDDPVRGQRTLIGERTPTQVVEEATLSLNAILNKLESADEFDRRTTLEQLVGRGNVNIESRIRVLKSNHVLVCDPLKPNANGPCLKPKCVTGTGF